MRRASMIRGGLAAPQADGILGTLADGIVARAGGGQTLATPLTGSMNIIATCATAGDSVLLPVADVGDEVFVRNNGAASCNVFPQSGGRINTNAVNTAFAVTAGRTALFKCTTGLNWVVVLSA